MLLNRSQKEKFKSIYRTTPMPQLMVIYGTNDLAIRKIAKVLGVYESKTGKHKKDRV